jgi:CRISPR-associated protein Csb1
MSTLTKFDAYLKDGGPAALVIRENLAPVEGPEGVLFPATFAAGDDFAGGYNIDGDPNGENYCLIDSVGSQANRIEPIFAKAPYAKLIPQVVVKAGEKRVNILEAGHRAGDALVRCSALQQDLQDAFKALLKGNAKPLADIAPTSLVFGVWDSRDTQAKLPRLVASTIRAFNVRKLTRSAQYNPATEYVNEKLLDEPTDKATKDAYAERGFIHVPATGSHGGVIAKGGIRRDATLSLAALRLLAAADEKSTESLRRYVLGLALVAFTANTSSYLRQGCMLVADRAKPREFVEVHPDGQRFPCSVTHESALDFAQEAANAFKTGQDREVDFDKAKAKSDVKGEGDTKKGKKVKKTESPEKPDGDK